MLVDEKIEMIPLNIHNVSHLFFDKASKMQAKGKKTKEPETRNAVGKTDCSYAKELQQTCVYQTTQKLISNKSKVETGNLKQ